MIDLTQLDDTSDQLGDAAFVKAAFGGRSDMWVWRRIQDGTLPKPIVIARRRYWRKRRIKALVDELAMAAE